MRLESGGNGKSVRNGSRRGGGGSGGTGAWWGSLLPMLLLPFLPLAAHAQQFIPPRDSTVDTTASALHLGIFGFGVRMGVDFAGRSQAVLSPTLDAGDLFTDRVRIRPSAEVGMGDTATTYVMNLELMYRFTAEKEMAIPYVTFGGALYSQERCAVEPDCPRIWAQFGLGFELKFREHINWLLEYHGEDGLRRHRFFIGLTTRRGGSP